MTFISDDSNGNIMLHRGSENPLAEMEVLCRQVCIRFGVKKVYFARSMGRRKHYLCGFGEETYLPPETVQVGPDLWAFIEGSGNLSPGVWQALRRLLETAGRRFASTV